MDGIQSNLAVRCVGGRYPHRVTKHFPETIQAALRMCGDELRIRIDDESNADRWEEFSLPVASLLTWLERHGFGANKRIADIPTTPESET